VAGVNVRDLAMLEVTALLHQDDEQGGRMVEHCSPLYGDRVLPSDDPEPAGGTDRERNTHRLVAEIRRRALASVDEPRIYALMVFDNALMQLGGLWLGSSTNKIRFPTDAALLAGLSTRWLRRVAPEFFNRSGPKPTSIGPLPW
jgi:hypothetical protein